MTWPRFLSARLFFLTFAAALLPGPVRAAAPPQPGGPREVAAAIDRLLEEHWRRANVRPAAPADELALLRRATLDLAGRVPTAAEVEQFRGDRSPDRYGAAVRRLLDGPEFSWHFGAVLDEMLQGRYAGNAAFVGYLRRSVQQNKPWDRLFREVMVGPWDTPDRKGAVGFLAPRARDVDQLTTDVTRSFFGVDVTCARCHNHPLVKDWKRDHYYGMMAFLVRTTGGRGAVSEKRTGEARYAARDGKQRTVPMMFLTGRALTEPAPVKGDRFSRREQLVRVALEERHFFSRAFVNRAWEYFFGRGLVDPVDQIHSGNRASVPELLDWLADDFARSGYDVRRLVTGIVLSRAYRLDSRWDGPTPNPRHFAVALLRPLSPRQLAGSLVVALEENTGPPAGRLAALEKRSAALAPALDARTRDFQSSAREALFLSNSEAVRKLIASKGGLADRLTALPDARARVDAAFRATLSRPPGEAVADRLVRWLAGPDRRAACEDLVWALVASAEFRFNH
jgi:hypothetical protein